MKVILSAFSCEPERGSEEAVGWGWVIGLSRRCDKVLVVTRLHHRDAIESWRSEHALGNVEFLYFEPPEAKWFRWLGRFKWVPYYIFWQRGILPLVRAAMAHERYDLVHHVTVVTMRFRVRLGELGLPFVYGPVAGGDETPPATWVGMTWRGKVGEALRWVSNRWLRVSPAIRRTLESASVIISTSDQTTALIPRSMRSKVREILAISYDEPLRPMQLSRRSQGGLSLVFPARCLDWKGLAIGLRAMARAVAEGADIHLTVIGDGPARPHWQRLARRLGIDQRIRWQLGMPRPEFLAALTQFDVLYFPSLHDSGALVVLEAMAHGLPALCVDAGGPGLIVDQTCGIKVPVGSVDSMALALSSGLLRLARDEDERLRLARGSYERIRDDFVLDRKIDAVMSLYPGYSSTRRQTSRGQVPQGV